jgi:hypothetical protein
VLYVFRTLTSSNDSDLPVSLKQSVQHYDSTHLEANLWKFGSNHCLNVRTCSNRGASTTVGQLVRRDDIEIEGGNVSPIIH